MHIIDTIRLRAALGGINANTGMILQQLQGDPRTLTDEEQSAITRALGDISAQIQIAGQILNVQSLTRSM